MSMTHYMELLATNQPWHLILFMAVPVILAETVAITELFILLHRLRAGPLVAINRTASIAGGIYFTGVFVYLIFNAVLPITRAGEWRGPADVIAVGAYLLGIVPLLGLALIDLGVIGRGWTHERRLARHALMVALFLVVAHIAMIFGMLDPAVLQGGAAAADAMGHGMGHAH
ncbi:DUF6803 family protein [Ottowia sp. SB7-C50]|uniref:DUF6803 family protein n=1 Tax=Ottowia sp. SB7-C50 TaxID=3081231 RepID=UPI0029544CDA|nr:DUF6803 family protein [Ottowia sp. SB7-C50]WOP14975.1 DUF6803 family protein [Ottowia sp. SB7-C50]